jgi:hypothetical protein
MAIASIDSGNHGAFSTSGGIYSVVAASPGRDTSVVRSGEPCSVQFNVANEYLRRTAVAFGSISLGSAARLASLPASTAQSICVASDGSTVVELRVRSDGKLAIWVGGSEYVASASAVISGATWYWLSLFVDMTTNPWRLKAAVDETEVISTTVGLAGSAPMVYGWGNTTADLVNQACMVAAVDHTPELLPKYKIRAFLPNGVGTHNLDASPSAHFEKIVSGSPTALTSAETDSWQTVDDVPIFADEDGIQVKAGLGAPGEPFCYGAGTFVGSAGTGSPGIPAGTVLNDILLLFVESENEAVTLSSAQGFVSVGTPTGTGVAGAADASRITVFWKRATGSDVAPTVADAGDHIAARILGFRGCKTSGNPWNGTPTWTVDSVSDTVLAANGPTTTVDNCLVVIGAANVIDTNTAQSLTYTNANLTGLGGSGFGDNTNQGSGGGLNVGLGTKVTAGAVGATTVTYGSATQKSIVVLALEGEASVTQPSNLLYAEYVFEDTAEGAAVAVSGVATLKIASGSGSNSITVKAEIGGTSNNIANAASVGSANVFYKATFGVNPSQTDFNAGKVRFGFTADAEPAPKMIAFQIEAIYADSAAPPPTTPISVNVGLTMTPTVSRVVGRRPTVALTLSPTVSRQVGRTVSVALPLSVTVRRALQQSISVALSLVPAVRRSVSRNVAVALTLSPSVSVSRAFARAISVALTLNASVSRSVGRKVEAPLTLVPTVSRQIGRRVTAALTLVPTVSRRISRSVVVALTLPVTVSRRVGRTIVAPLILTPSVALARAFVIAIQVPLTMAVTVSRQIDRKLSVALNFAVSVIADSGGVVPPAVKAALKMLRGFGR